MNSIGNQGPWANTESNAEKVVGKMDANANRD